MPTCQALWVQARDGLRHKCDQPEGHGGPHKDAEGHNWHNEWLTTYPRD